MDNNVEKSEPNPVPTEGEVLPAVLLRRALTLLSKDIEHIEASAELGKLDPDTSMTLVRYITALISLQKDHEAAAANAQKSLSRMSTDELVALANQLGGKKP